MVSKIASATLFGVDALLVDVETQILGSLRKFTLVGLPDGVLKESRERVRCAIENSGFEFPTGEVVVNLAPAALPKNGSGFDLAIALGILSVSGVLPKAAFTDSLILGELALDGTLKPGKGAIAAAILARKAKKKRLLLPERSAGQAAHVSGLEVFGIKSLAHAVAFLSDQAALSPSKAVSVEPQGSNSKDVNFTDVVGQFAAKRALEIVAAGGHNLLFVGPPGAGKSMLARCITHLLPPLAHDEALEVTKIYSVTDETNRMLARDSLGSGLITRRPFRAPHHSTSQAGLIGGGSHPQPGEISLAHKGVLFLDELPEFRRDVLESLRQPLENRTVIVSRARISVKFPCDFILLAAMNPCPCGRFGAGRGACRCSQVEIKKYLSRISGPLLDRIDLQVWVPPVPISDLVQKNLGETSSDLLTANADRVKVARERQRQRFDNSGKLNSVSSASELKRFCKLGKTERTLLESAGTKYMLSARGFVRTLKVARTIADLEGNAEVSAPHIAEALSYRVGALGLTVTE